MKPQPSTVSIACALGVLATAAMLDLIQKPPLSFTAQRGDRIDVMESAQRCGASSMMAACADAEFDDVARLRAKNGAVLQIFNRPGETIAMRVRLGDG